MQPNPWVAFLLIVVPMAVASSCGFLLEHRSASKSERAKIEQLVSPLSHRGAPLRSALAAIVEAAPLPVKVDICGDLQEAPVTIITTTPLSLGVLVRGAAMQVGAPVRLFIGEHGEVARPTIFCPQGDGTLITVAKSQS
jgi:hypothetical protein